MGESLAAVHDSYLSGQEVRAVLGISKSTFLALVKSGDLAAIKVGTHFKVSGESLKDYIARNRVRPQ